MKYPLPNQVSDLIRYIKNGNDFSIYGDSGIYATLENEICKIYKQKYCILTNSGTSALSSAYFGLDLKRGDEVIVSIYTFISTVTPLLRIGCIPIFADVNSEDGNIDPNCLKKILTKKTKAVVVTHMWGVPCQMDRISIFCKKYKLKLIEDCSHAHLTRFKRKLLGTFGDVACFSVGAKKTLSGGEGGFLITNNEKIYIRATLLGHFNMRAVESLKKISKKSKQKYKKYTSGFGENYRMHPYSAVMIYSLLTKDLIKVINHIYKIEEYFAQKIKKINNIEIHPIVWGGLYGFKPKIKNINLDEFIKEVNMVVKIKKLDTVPLYDDAIFKNCKFPLDYSGAREYMNGRFSVPNDFISGNLKKDFEMVDLYINSFFNVINKIKSKKQL